jgi:hypothetical protein
VKHADCILLCFHRAHTVDTRALKNKTNKVTTDVLILAAGVAFLGSIFLRSELNYTAVILCKHDVIYVRCIPIYIQQDATLHSLFISRNCCTCFGWFLHPSSGAHTTISAASGICHTITATCRYRGRTGSSYNYICSIWYLLYHYCYLPLSWKSFQLFHDSGR